MSEKTKDCHITQAFIALIAEYVGPYDARAEVAVFIDKMKRKSKEAGLVETHFPAKNIILTISGLYGVSIGDIMGKSRTASYIIPRHLAMYLVWKMLKKTYPETGKLFNRDHTTIMHAVDNIQQKMEGSQEFRVQVEQIMDKISTEVMKRAKEKDRLDKIAAKMANQNQRQGHFSRDTEETSNNVVAI